MEKERGRSPMNVHLKLVLNYSILNIFVISQITDNLYGIIKLTGLITLHCTKALSLNYSSYSCLLDTTASWALNRACLSSLLQSFSSILNIKYNVKQNLEFFHIQRKKRICTTCFNICVRWFEISKAITKQVLSTLYNISCLKRKKRWNWCDSHIHASDNIYMSDTHECTATLFLFNKIINNMC